MKEFTIYRSSWGRTTLRAKVEVSMLYNPETEKKCCMGFYLEACGVSLKKMERNGMPKDLPLRFRPKETAWLDERADGRPTFAIRLAQINDSCTSSDEYTRKYTAREKEAAIRKIFKANGIRVKFSSLPEPSKR